MPNTSTIRVGLDATRFADQLDIIAKHAKACADELRALADGMSSEPQGLRKSQASADAAASWLDAHGLGDPERGL